LNDEEAWVARISQRVQSNDDLEMTVRGTLETVCARDALNAAAATLRGAIQSEAETSAKWQDQCRQVGTLLASIGLSEDRVDAVLQLGEGAMNHQWDLNSMACCKKRLQFVLASKDLIRDLTRHTEERQQVKKLLEEHDAKEQLLKARIAKSESLQTTLDKKINENEEIDRQRAAEKGLKWFIITIFRRKTCQLELDFIRKEHVKLDQQGAEFERGNLNLTRYSEQNRINGLDGSIQQECVHRKTC
jgi:hypothetical protein